MRGASTAIRELAPFNTFYAEARKVVIDQVETGGRSNSQIEEWRFCDVCSHMEREAEAQNKVTCPNCGSPGWADVGQKRSLLKLTPGVGPLRSPAEPDLRRLRRAGTPDVPAQGLHRHSARRTGAADRPTWKVRSASST